MLAFMLHNQVTCDFVSYSCGVVVHVSILQVRVVQVCIVWVMVAD